MVTVFIIMVRLPLTSSHDQPSYSYVRLSIPPRKPLLCHLRMKSLGLVSGGFI